MKRSLRRQVRILQVYAAGSSLAIVAVGSVGMAQSSATQRIDELTVQRLNVIDANGTLRPAGGTKRRAATSPRSRSRPARKPLLDVEDAAKPDMTDNSERDISRRVRARVTGRCRGDRAGQSGGGQVEEPGRLDARIAE